MNHQQIHKEKLGIQHFWFPLAFVAIMWLVKGYEVLQDKQLYQWGVYPGKINSLWKIFTAPFIHEDFNHLINNTIPIVILGLTLIYFYRPIAYRIFFWIWIMSGLWLWALARPAYHIGASGIIYGLASFIFFSGIFRKYYKLIAISLLVVFLYGSMIWGIFPLKQDISFEAHFYGFIAGLILAYYYRKEGPQRPLYEWEIKEEEDDDDDELHHHKIPYHHNPHVKVHYHIKKTEKKDL